MKAKMMRAKLKNQFAAVFAVAPVFPFFDVLTFPLCGEKCFFFSPF